MQPDYIALSVPVFFVLIALELGYSVWKQRHWYHLADALTNIACGIGQQLTGIFVKSLLFAGYIFLYQHARFFTLPEGWLSGIILFLGVDFCYYWFHRLSHEINAIWATHIVHHQSEDYNLTVALRQSWFQAFFSNIFYLPLALLGFHPTLTLTVIAINTLYQFWIHTELIRSMGWFEWVFNTPSHHRVHHGSNPQYIDRNHGGTLIIWDRLFGTFEKEHEPVVYGITHPLRSWNPIWANLHYWRDLFLQASRFTRWTDRLRLFLAAPGWQPVSHGGRSPVPEVQAATFHKFQVHLPRRHAAYVVVQFSIVLAFASFLLFQAGQFPLQTLAFPAAMVLFSLLSLGSMLEKRPYALRLESLRLLLLPLIVFFLPFSSALLISVLLYVSASLGSLFLLRS